MLNELNVSENFTLQQEHYRDLRQYVVHAIYLPQTVGAYCKEVALHNVKLEDHIGQLVVLYNAIHDHCLHFDATTFKEIINFMNDVKDYSDLAVSFHPVVHNFLANVGKGKAAEVVEDQKSQTVVKRDRDFLYRTLSKAEVVLKGIDDFWKEIVQDSTGVDREMASFDRYLMDTNMEETTLTRSVNALRDLVAHLDTASGTNNLLFNFRSHDDKDFMPFVGWIPKAIIANHLSARYHAKCIYDRLHDLENNQGSLPEVCNLQGIIMLSSLGKVKNLLILAQRSIELFQGFFESLHGRLAQVESNIKEVTPLWREELEAEAWRRLSRQAKHFVENVRVTEPYADLS